MLSNFVQRKIETLDREESHKKVLLQILRSFNFKELDKKEYIYKLCMKYLKNGNKILVEGQFLVVDTILFFVQDLLNQICSLNQCYGWMLLKVQYKCLLIKYIYANPHISAIKRSLYLKRLSFFICEIKASEHYKKLKSDFYSQIESCFFYSISYAFGCKFFNKSKGYIQQCFQSLRDQILLLCQCLEQYEDHKIYTLIQKKTHLMLKLYAVQLVYNLLKKRNLDDVKSIVWERYYKVLLKTPCNVDSSQILDLIERTFMADHMNKQMKEDLNLNDNIVSSLPIAEKVDYISEEQSVDESEQEQTTTQNYISLKDIFKKSRIPLLQRRRYSKAERNPSLLRRQRQSRISMKSQTSRRQSSVYSSTEKSQGFLPFTLKKRNKQKYISQEKQQKKKETIFCVALQNRGKSLNDEKQKKSLTIKIQKSDLILPNKNNNIKNKGSFYCPFFERGKKLKL